MAPCEHVGAVRNARRPWLAKVELGSLFLIAAMGLSMCQPRASTDAPPTDSVDVMGEVPDSPPPRALCGQVGEACCGGVLLPCAAGLECDAQALVCGPTSDPTAALAVCRDDRDCAAEEVCCPPASLGRCMPVALGEGCPLPDLQVLLPGSAFRSEERFVDSVCTFDDEGRVMCMRGRGWRRSLTLDFVVANLGMADLILGDPLVAPGFEVDACQERPVLKGFLSRQLFTLDGALVLDFAEPMRCIDCDFTAGSMRHELPCQAIDITDVPAGDYVLRTTVNPDLSWPESDYSNNRLDIAFSLPSFDPLSPCPPVQGPNGLLEGIGQECGWRAAPQFTGVSCTPGDWVALGCSECDGTAVLRACERGACTSARALADGELGSYDDSGALVSICPSLEFKCPPTGSYTALIGSYFPASLPPRCELEEREP